MGTHRLIAHPDHPPAIVKGVTAQLTIVGEELLLRFRVEGHEQLLIPPFAGMGRADELWRTTCFELYVQGEGTTGYAEFNFSPSQRWAAYSFSDYREGMRELPMGHEPVCQIAEGERFFVMDVKVSAATLPPLPWTIGLSAIIEEDGGAKSYWALAHAAGKPDFHHPACFAETIAAPGP